MTPACCDSLVGGPTAGQALPVSPVGASHRPARHSSLRWRRRELGSGPLASRCLFSALLLVALLAGTGSATVDVGNLPTAHVIPHSHCDPGWLSTFETYYNNDVNMILNNVVDVLIGDEGGDKTFIWSETSFFNKW